MQKKIKSTSLFTWRGRSGSTSTLPQPPSSASITDGKLYISVNSLPLDRFKKIFCSDDLSQLFINPNDYVLTPEVYSTWDGIMEEFMDGMQDKEGLYKIRLIAKINNLEFTYKIIHLCVKYLQQARDPEIIDILGRFVLAGQFNTEDMQSYTNDLQVVLNRAQGILATIEEKKAELSVIDKPSAGSAKTTTKQFDQLVASVSIFAKFHIDKKSTTVSEFMEYYTARRENIEAMEAAYDKVKR